MELFNISNIFLVGFIFMCLMYLDGSRLLSAMSSNENLFFESLGVALFVSNITSESGNWLLFSVLPPLILGLGLGGWAVSVKQVDENSIEHLMKNFSPAKLLLGLTLFVGAIEVFSSILRPLTLNLRLLANVMGGHLIAELMSDMKMVKPLFFLTNYETFVCFMQSLIFAILIFNYIKEMKNLM